jgi:4-amino-4-deoxy-L-arabinose transferase-like glycosyltransferase
MQQTRNTTRTTDQSTAPSQRSARRSHFNALEPARGAAVFTTPMAMDRFGPARLRSTARDSDIEASQPPPRGSCGEQVHAEGNRGLPHRGIVRGHMHEAMTDSGADQRWEAKLESLGWAVPIAFLLAVALRFDTFFGTTVDDWDEAVYLLMAQSINAGHAPYTEIWDHKPPGLYFLFAWSFRIFGEGVFSVRIIGLLAAAGLGLSVRALWRNVFGRVGVAGWVAMLLAMFFSQRYSGRANVEIYFLPWTTMGMALLLPLVPGLGAEPSRSPTLQAGLAGVMFGIAFQLKYVVAFDVAAAALIMTIAYARRPGAVLESAKHFAAQGLAIMAGFALPWLIVFGYFVAHGAVDAYSFSNFAANSVHASTDRLGVRGELEFAARMFDELPLFFGLALILYPLTRVTSSNLVLRARAAAFSGWALFALLGVLSPGKAYTHYCLQVTPPLACCAAFALDSFVLQDVRSRIVRLALAGVIVVAGAGAFVAPALLATLDQISRVTGIGHQRIEAFSEIGDYLRPQLASGDTIFVLDAEPIIYFNAGVRPPTRYVFPPFLLDDHFIRVAGIDARAELARIMGQRPAFVIRKKGEQLPEHAHIVTEQLATHYETARVIDSYELLRLKR